MQANGKKGGKDRRREKNERLGGADQKKKEGEGEE